MRCVKLHASLAHVCSVGRCVSLGCCFVGFVLLLPSHGVRHEVCADVRLITFTVAILAQGTNRGDALCAALLSNRVVSILHDSTYLFLLLFPCSFVVFEFVFVLKIKIKRDIGPRERSAESVCEFTFVTQKKSAYPQKASYLIFFRRVFLFLFSCFSFLLTQKAYSTRRFSRAVPHHGTCRALTGLTSEFRWDRVYS